MGNYPLDGCDLKFARAQKHGKRLRNLRGDGRRFLLVLTVSRATAPTMFLTATKRPVRLHVLRDDLHRLLELGRRAELYDLGVREDLRRLAREEGIFGGFSGGACLVAAERLLRDRYAGQTIAIVIADSGMKYLSTDLWDTEGYGSR